MSNPYYTESFTGQAGQTARAEEVKTEFDGVQAGFDGVNADILRTLRGQAAESIAAMPAAANRANKWLRFDANGDPLPTSAPFNWRGLWQPATLYYVGDVVQIGTHQSLVYCTTQHTSGASYSGTNWSVFIDLTGVAFFNYSLVNAAGATSLKAGDAVFVDSSGGDITLNLPAAPALGDSPINITHVGGTLAAGQAITIVSAAGTFIMGTVENTLNLDTANASFSLSYGGATYGWRLRVMG